MNKKKNLSALFTKMNPELRRELVEKTRKYLCDEHEVEIGDFEVEELIGFILENAAPPIYNQGIEDAKRYFASRFEEFSEDIVQIEIDKR